MRKFVRCLAFSLGLFFCGCTAYFDSIAEMVAYASKIPSDTPNQSVDPYKTQFRKFHRAIPTLTETSFFSKIGFHKNRIINEFKDMLKRVVLTREQGGYYGDFVQKFYIEDETKWYIWGALHGAFHSLVRGLSELKKFNVIGDNLVLLSPSSYLVFNGNLINYGAYNIETLLVILKLVEKNPSRVILIKGAFEQEGAWQKTNMQDELRTRFGYTLKGIPLEKEISALFNTFALATYLISTEGDVLRISFYEHHSLLVENTWGDFFKKKTTEVRKIKFIMQLPADQVIRARINAHAVQEVPYTIPALAYERDGDMHAWKLFSAPLNVFRAYFNFYEDVSIQLTTARYFSNWLLTLFNQDPNNPKGFMRTREFEVATGKEIFTADPAKRLEDLAEKIELAKSENKHLKAVCKAKKGKAAEAPIADKKSKQDAQEEIKK